MDLPEFVLIVECLPFPCVEPQLAAFLKACSLLGRRDEELWEVILEVELA